MTTPRTRYRSVVGIETEIDLVAWLLGGDPAICRWAQRDVVNAPREEFAAERARVAPARRRSEEYLLAPRLLRRLSTGEVVE